MADRALDSALEALREEFELSTGRLTNSVMRLATRHWRRQGVECYSALAYYHEHPDEMQKLRRSRDEAEAVLAEESLSPPEPAK